MIEKWFEVCFRAFARSAELRPLRGPGGSARRAAACRRRRPRSPHPGRPSQISTGKLGPLGGARENCSHRKPDCGLSKLLRKFGSIPPREVLPNNMRKSHTLNFQNLNTMYAIADKRETPRNFFGQSNRPFAWAGLYAERTDYRQIRSESDNVTNKPRTTLKRVQTCMHAPLGWSTPKTHCDHTRPRNPASESLA